MTGGTLNELYIVCCEYYGYEFAGVQCRRQDIADAKAMFAYIARQDMQCTYETIAHYVGWKNHSSVVHACREMEFYVEMYRNMRKKYADIKEAYEFRKFAGILAETRKSY